MPIVRSQCFDWSSHPRNDLLHRIADPLRSKRENILMSKVGCLGAERADAAFRLGPKDRKFCCGKWGCGSAVRGILGTGAREWKDTRPASPPLPTGSKRQASCTTVAPSFAIMVGAGSIREQDDGTSPLGLRAFIAERPVTPRPWQSQGGASHGRAAEGQSHSQFL
jgi:hypothetical protein